MSRSLSSGAHSRDPLAHPGYQRQENASAAAADASDLSIEFHIVGMTRLRNGGRIAALGLTVCRQRRVSGQARVGCQRRRDGWIGRPQSAVPHMTVTPMSVAVATPGESTGAPRQRQNYPRQDQLAHTHYNHPTPHQVPGLNARFHRWEVPDAMPDYHAATLSSANRPGQSIPPDGIGASANDRCRPFPLAQPRVQFIVVCGVTDRAARSQGMRPRQASAGAGQLTKSCSGTDPGAAVARPASSADRSGSSPSSCP